MSIEMSSTRKPLRKVSFMPVLFFFKQAQSIERDWIIFAEVSYATAQTMKQTLVICCLWLVLAVIPSSLLGQKAEKIGRLKSELPQVSSDTAEIRILLS